MKKMKVFLVILLMGFFFTETMNAQPNPAKVVGEMENFSWMVGDWMGDAWYIGPSRVREELKQTEDVEFKVGETIITMQGTGYKEDAASGEAEVLFQAFGILTYDLANSKFVIRAYNNGNFIDSDLVTNEDGSYSWGMEFPYGKIRYTLRLTEDGKWKEVGEFSSDGGSSWFQNFEMILSRVE